MNKHLTHKGQAIFVCLILSLCSLRSFSNNIVNSTSSESTSALSGSSVTAIVDIKLLWPGQLESPNSEMIIERSFDQANYKPVALFFSPGDDYMGVNSYTFKDKSSDLSGRNHAWYRIKQTDMCGKVNYSEGKLIEFSTQAIPELKLAPNPFTD